MLKTKKDKLKFIEAIQAEILNAKQEFKHAVPWDKLTDLEKNFVVLGNSTLDRIYTRCGIEKGRK